ncbi:MAG: DUF1893 domain-containing protein [Candidatus Zixiibacteriota bacterium]|nr:MAG: DUF1893 domain-containing protein [candidate division Zixibacteria bacterium]
MYSYERFLNSKWSLVITESDRIIFRSRATAIKPLIRYLKQHHKPGRQVIIYDKYVGRAAALLMVLIKPVKVFTPVISFGGEETLKEFQVPYKAQKRVEYLMGMASDEMCRWEKMTIGKTPEEFRDMLK